MLATTIVSTGCTRTRSRSPERLREEWVSALANDDARAAYALLGPELRRKLPFATFEARWKLEAAEHKAAATAAKALGEGQTLAVREGTTVHEGGRVLRWAATSEAWLVVDGLPGSAPTATPAQTIRSLIAAVRRTDLSAVRALLGDELAAALGEDWNARAQAMEDALDRPGAIELSADLRRAELRYEQGKAVTLEQTKAGWRITSFE